MKKKLFAGFLAAVLAMSMTVTAFANEVNDFTAGGTDVGGEGTVLAVEDVYDVIVPTNVNYAINPDELNGKPQIMSGSFGVINHGSTNVQVDVAASVSGSSVTMSDADTIAAINNATEASAVNEEKLLYLAVAPVASGASVTANTVITGSASYTDKAYADVGFDVTTAVATSAAVAIPANGSSDMAFKLPAANYTAALSGSGAVTTGGGFDTNNIEAVQTYQGDYTNDPVAAFTLIGSVNKYADWTGVTLPEVALTFTLTELNDLEYAELEVDAATENMIVSGNVAKDDYVIRLQPDGSAKYTFVKAPGGNGVISNITSADGLDRTGAVASNLVTYSNGVLTFTATPVSKWLGATGDGIVKVTISGIEYEFTYSTKAPAKDDYVIKIQSDGTAKYTFVNPPSGSGGITNITSADGLDRTGAVANNLVTYSDGVLTFTATPVSKWLSATGSGKVKLTINGTDFEFTVQ